MDIRKNLSFGFEQTFTTPDWWTEPGFVSTSDTPKKRELMLACAEETAKVLGGRVKESLDVWNHVQYEVINNKGDTQFYVTMDPGSIEVKTPPCLIDQIEEINAPMFQGAQNSGLVTYRNWWYGVKGGTEGGCHVNMGGLSPATNPLHHDPKLVARYFAWLHNHPEFHFPFMGPDTGPGGNAQRMDEHDAENAIDPLIDILKQERLSSDELRLQLAETTLVKEKSSMPSLTKFKGPDYLLEDRGQEAPYNEKELRLVCEWRVKVFEKLQFENVALEKFPRGFWHGQRLSSVFLWDRFYQTASELGLNPQDYRVFFDRQFPLLFGGNNLPQSVQLREGRRPRIITNVQKRGETVISKTVDTRHKRFEMFIPDGSWSVRFGESFIAPDWQKFGSGYFAIIDLFIDNKDKTLEFISQQKVQGRFNPTNMTWE